jgi:hypothetical protein
MGMSILLSVVAIVVCGFFGAIAGWSAMTALGLSGIVAAILAAVLGMVVAALGWVAGVALRNRVSRRPPPGNPGKGPT